MSRDLPPSVEDSLARIADALEKIAAAQEHIADAAQEHIADAAPTSKRFVSAQIVDPERLLRVARDRDAMTMAGLTRSVVDGRSGAVDDQDDRSVRDASPGDAAVGVGDVDLEDIARRAVARGRETFGYESSPSVGRGTDSLKGEVGTASLPQHRGGAE